VTGPRRSESLRRWGGAVVSLLAVSAVVVWATRQDAPRLPTDPDDLAGIAAAVALYGVATLARGWRWHRILTRLGASHRRLDAYALTTVGYMGNTVLPARGGEVLRTVLLAGRSRVGKAEVAGTILSERALDAVSLVVLFAALTWAGVAGTPLGQRPALLALAVLAAGGATAWAYLRARRRGRLATVAGRIRPLVRASRPLLGPFGLALLVLSLVIWLLEGTIFWLVADSLSLGVGPPDALFLVVLSAFSALIPAAPGYVGTFDTAVVFGLKAVGVAGGQAVAFLLLVRFVLFVPVTFVGLVLFLTRYSRLRRPARAPGPRVAAGVVGRDRP
jgi:glycosyltransferase 2 family protein